MDERTESKPDKGDKKAKASPTESNAGDKVKVKNAHIGGASYALAEGEMGPIVRFSEAFGQTHEVTAQQAEYLLKQKYTRTHENGRVEELPRFVRA